MSDDSLHVFEEQLHNLSDQAAVVVSNEVPENQVKQTIQKVRCPDLIGVGLLLERRLQLVRTLNIVNQNIGYDLFREPLIRQRLDVVLLCKLLYTFLGNILVQFGMLIYFAMLKKEKAIGEANMKLLRIEDVLKRQRPVLGLFLFFVNVAVLVLSFGGQVNLRHPLRLQFPHHFQEVPPLKFLRSREAFVELGQQLLLNMI